MRILILGFFLLAPFSTSFANGLKETLWKTDYISSLGTYQVYFKDSDQVTISKDPNHCGLDDLGRINGCTKMAVSSSIYQFEVAPISTNRRTLAYNVIESSSGVVKYRLVSTWPLDPSNPEALRLLLLDENGRVVESLRLSNF